MTVWPHLGALTVSVSAALTLLATGAGAGSDTIGGASGAAVYASRCSSCHGARLEGTARGPALGDVGAAAVDFVLATGRMPAAGTGVQPARNPHRLGEDDRVAVTGYVAAVGGGPAIPEVDVAGADPVRGGRLFREHCAACHQAGAAGAALSGGRHAPSLGATAPTQLVEAMMIGPGAMPVLALDEQQQTDIAAYLQQLDDRAAPGGASLGRIGPVAEGLAAWALGLAPLLLVTSWATRRRRGTVSEDTDG